MEKEIELESAISIAIGQISACEVALSDANNSLPNTITEVRTSNDVCVDNVYWGVESVLEQTRKYLEKVLRGDGKADVA